MSDAQPGGIEAAISERLVAAYLAEHPDFFTRHAELLGTLVIPHQSGGAVSLIEHQVTVLRGQLDAERARLGFLIERAREYEQLSSRLHALVLTLIAAPDLATLEAELGDAMMREFNAEAVALKLYAVDPDSGTAADPVIAAFLEFVSEDKVLCGPIDSERTNALFGEGHQGITSAALIPIRIPDQAGLLAVGSTDAERFSADMGTDLLDRLGEVVSARVRTLNAQDHG